MATIPARKTGLVEVELEDGWLQREIQAARQSVSKWSEWKRNALRDQMLEDGPIGPPSDSDPSP